MISTLVLVELIYYISESCPKHCIEALFSSASEDGHDLQEFLDELGLIKENKHD